MICYTESKDCIYDADGATYMTSTMYSKTFSISNRLDILQRCRAIRDKLLIVDVNTLSGTVQEMRIIPEDIYVSWLKRDKPEIYLKYCITGSIRTYYDTLE